MGYGKAAVEMLGNWVGSTIPRKGKLLELGSQDINKNVPIEVIRDVLLKVHHDSLIADQIIEKYFISAHKVWKVADIFRRSDISYAAIDMYPGEFVIEADLNSYRTPDESKNQFDLVTNHGTSEHVFDQVNLFRVIHDHVKPGGHFFHAVPFTGYFNHGLYNYHPAFFLFLAHANKYEIKVFNLSVPHLEHTIPVAHWFSGSESWQGLVFNSGILSCVLRKVHDMPFSLFTDYDRNVITEEWSDLSEMLKDRYDLRVR